MFCDIQDVTELNYKPQNLQRYKNFYLLETKYWFRTAKDQGFHFGLGNVNYWKSSSICDQVLFHVSIWNVLYLILKCLPVSMPTLLCFSILWYLLFYHDLHSQSGLILLLPSNNFFYQDTYLHLKLCITSFSLPPLTQHLSTNNSSN